MKAQILARSIIGTVLLSILLLVSASVAAQENRGTLDENVQMRVVNLASNVTTRLTAGTGRYGDIIARLETRIAKMEAEGKNTGAAKAKLEEAEQSLIIAVTSLSSIGSVQESLSGETPRESWAGIRNNILGVREELRTTHALLAETITLLKSAGSVPESAAEENS